MRPAFLFALGVFAFAWVTASSCGGSSQTDSVKFRQYFLKGEELYLTHCSNCHQKNGKGLARLYPPLDSADYLSQYPEETICIIKNGKTGELTVNGVVFNQPMPGFPTLTDIEIAQISTYISNAWSNRKGIIEVKAVTETLSRCR